MSRTRLAVALLVPPPLDREVDGLRRALGDRRRTRIAPHITLVPPVNVAVADVPAVLQVLRDAADPATALDLELGPVADFGARSGIAFLQVSGAAPVLAALDALQEACSRGPLGRPARHPFVPHVTVADRLEPERVVAVTEVLGSYAAPVRVDRLHLLEHRHDGGGPRWEAVADLAFARPAVVGRGGYELTLRASRLADPEVLALLAAARDDAAADPDGSDPLGDPPGAGVPLGAASEVVTARLAERLVGAGWGWSHPTLAGEIAGVVVAADERGRGVGRQVRLALEARLAGTVTPPA